MFEKSSLSPSRLHVALIAPAMPVSGLANGIVTYVAHMRDALRAAGHRVSVIAANAFEDAFGEQHSLPGPSRAQRFATNCRISLQPDRRDILASTTLMTAAVRHVHQLDPIDVLEVEESFGWARALSRVGPKVVVRLHGPHVYGRDSDEGHHEQRRSNRREIEEGKALPFAAALSCPSRRLLTATLAHFRLQPHIAETIANPMPTLAIDRRWRLSDADVDQFLTIGRFDSRKGADIVLKAFEQVALRREKARLVFIGPDAGLTTSGGTRVHFDDFMRTEMDPKVRSRVLFLGKQTATEIATIRRRSAFSVIGSRFENFPYSLAEAMAFGTTSIVSDSFGNGEMVQAGKTGLIVPVGDVAAMTKAMMQLHNNPDLIAAMANSAWQRCRVWLDPDRIARDTLRLYRRTVP